MSVAVSALQSPYKGLAAFDDSDLDALLFFGRERESEVIAANLMAARLTVLYGPSGVGKSSVLRAGVAHRLRQELEAEVIVFSTWTGDPVGALIEAARGSGESLVDALADAADRAGGDLYLILDQFEECFLYHRNGGRFAAELAAIVKRPGLRVNVLIGMREDALARLDALKAGIPNLLANRLRLERLDRAAGATAITGPVARYNDLVAHDARIEIEPRLVDAILDEVTAGRVDLGVGGRGVVFGGRDENRIEAPYLQLVLARLWEVELARGSRKLTLATLGALGGAERIVEDHLERAMAALSPREKGAAAAMYNFLVTPSGTKIAHGIGDLAGYAAVDEGEAGDVLQRLTAERIVRASSENGPSTTRYEIFHDVLADAVLAWRTRFEGERALAGERQEHRRRQRRLLAIFGVSLLAFACMAAVAVYALAQRSNARHQTTLARGAEAQAQHQTVIAKKRSREAEHQSAIANTQRGRANRSEKKAKRSAAVANAERLDALRQKAIAEGNRRRAVRFGQLEAAARARAQLSTRRAHRQELKAKAATAVALRQKQIVRARQVLADARARLGDDPVASTRGALRALAVSRRARINAGFVEKTLREGLLALRVEAVLSAGGAVTATRFSPDGSLVLVAGRRGARLFDGSGHFVRRLGRATPLSDAVFSPDGRLVAGAGGGNDDAAHVWDVASGLELATLVHSGPVLAVAFSPDGRLIATGSADGTARVWSVATGLPLGAGFQHPAGVSRPDDVQMVSFSPDSRRLLTVGGDRFARLFDVDRHEEIRRFDQRAALNVARFSHDGAEVATAGASDIVRVWDVSTGVERATLQGTGGVTDLAFSPDDKLLATAGGNDTIARIWNVAKQSSVGAVTAHRSGVESVAFSPDGASILTAGRDGKAYIARSDSGFVQAALLGHTARVVGASFSPDGHGQKVLTGSEDGSARLWDGRVDRSGPWPPAVPAAIGKAGVANVVAVLPSGLSVTLGPDRIARVWLPSGESLSCAPSPPVNDAALSRNGKLVITAGQDGKARVWTLGGSLVTTISHGEQALNRARFSDDGRFVVTAGEDGWARVWRANGAQVQAFHHGAAVNDARFSPNGKLVVTAGDDRVAAIWRVSDGRRLRTLTGHDDVVVAASFSPSGSLVATGSVDFTARVWDARTGGPTAVLRVHQGSVNDVAFSADERWLATAGPGSAGIWRSGGTGRWPTDPTYLVRPPPTTRINDVVFSSHGWRLVLGSRDGAHAYDCRLCGGVTRLAAIARSQLNAIVRARP